MLFKHLKNQNKAKKRPKNNQAWLFLAHFEWLLTAKHPNALPLMLGSQTAFPSGICHPQLNSLKFF